MTTTDSPQPPGDAVLDGQSLAIGAVGVALRDIERARVGLDTPDVAHRGLTECARHLFTGARAALYLGAPAVGFVVRVAAHGSGRYANALRLIDDRVGELIRRRLVAAEARIDAGQTPEPAEFDLFYGLTGLGTYLWHRGGDTTDLRRVLSYLVRLTHPLRHRDRSIPGWWTHRDPSGHESAELPGGHGNLGMAHGVSGVLSLLAITYRDGIVVPGHAAAIDRVRAWLSECRQESPAGPWWPGWITMAEQRAGSITQHGPQRPSWCYGTPGIARAQQLASIALGDAAWQRDAEGAMASCVFDGGQLAMIDEAGLCHGAAGLLHTTRRIAADACSVHAAPLGACLDRLRWMARTLPVAGGEDGFLHGAAGRDLALLSDRHGGSGWDACLLSG